MNIMATTLPVGTLLLPNDYQVRRGDPVSGIILGPSKIRPDEYEVYLSNGITRDIGPRIIKDLFEPVQSDPVT